MGDRRRDERQDGRVPTQPVPTLRPGDAVIPDNRSDHKSPGGAQTVQDIAARFPLLPPYSPDLDPMEMAFSKLKILKPKGRRRGPAISYGKPSDMFATSSRKRNAATAS